ncbi:uncharacterized protein LOC135614363 isoform X1 [Musa acuminata AAA Group]|uniref:uncharacterized protein LOC135614363 isoform X1 n=1 Tax=Musa acuminata AAA Group TaxID=214697 RepID=UPI0031D0CB28
MGLKSLLHHHSLGAALGTAAPLLAAASHPIGGGGLILLPPPLFSLPPACPSHFRHRLPPLLPSPPFLRICWDQRRKRGQMAGGLVGGSGGGGGGLNPTVVRFVLVVMALGLAGYIVGPPLYWHLAEALGRSSACPLCAPCDCSAQPLLSLPQELINVSSTDCAKHDPEVSEEMDKNFTDLLAEELKLREEEATEAQHRADVKLLEAKKLASQYQKEADKCNSGMDTCEEAREKAEAALLEQKKQTSMWELRARQRGWKNTHAY